MDDEFDAEKDIQKTRFMAITQKRGLKLKMKVEREKIKILNTYKTFLLTSV